MWIPRQEPDPTNKTSGYSHPARTIGCMFSFSNFNCSSLPTEILLGKNKKFSRIFLALLLPVENWRLAGGWFGSCSVDWQLQMLLRYHHHHTTHTKSASCPGPQPTELSSFTAHVESGRRSGRPITGPTSSRGV